MMSRVAVLMAAYNAEKTIRRAVSSILESSYAVDLFIIDDGSKQPVSEVIETGQPGIYIHRLPHNVGLPEALNIGLGIILKKEYEYIARFDADDVSFPDRFAKQVAYLDVNPDVDVLGTWVRAVEEKSGRELFRICHPTHHADILKGMNYNSMFVHPSVMFRVDALRKIDSFYTSKYYNTEDYELLWRLVKRFKSANIPEILLDYTYMGSDSLTGKRIRHLLNRLRIQFLHFNCTCVHSWGGIIKTLSLFLIPKKPLEYLKVSIGLISARKK